MATKAELKKESDITKEVKKDEEAVADAVKEVVHDTKEGVKELAEKTEDMSIKEAPEKLLPSAEQVDAKLQGAQQALTDLSDAKRHKVGLNEKPKIQEIISDAKKILQDERNILQAKTEDGALGDAIQRTANIAQIVSDQTFATLDKLWSNWASMLTVVAAGSAGSWKSILEEGGRLINDLRHTQDFVKLLNDLKTTFFALYDGAQKEQTVQGVAGQLSKEWAQKRDLLMQDLQKVYAVLNKSPIWKRLLKQGQALKAQVEKVAAESKGEIEEAAEKVTEGSDTNVLKGDLKAILQNIVGNNGPKVDDFLDYATAAWEDILGNEAYSRWATEMDALMTTVSMDASKTSEQQYEKQYEELYNSTKDLLDHTLNNENLNMAMRESRKLIKSAKSDPATKKLIDDAAHLVKDISNPKGTSLLDPKLLEEIRSCIVPIMVDHFDNAPLPDYEAKDSNALGKFRYKLSGIRLGTTGLVPSKVKVEFRYKAIADPSKLQMNEQKMYMYVEIADIQVAFKDVKWEYERFSIPHFSDNGTVDLSTAGKGICLKLKAEIENFHAPEHAHSFAELLEAPKEHKMFKVLKAECLIDDFHINISGAGGSNLLYEALAGIWGTKIKHQIEHQLEAKIKILSDRFNLQLYDIVRRATAPSLASEAKDALLSAKQLTSETLEMAAQGIKGEANVVKAAIADM
uniref:Predicted protein n=1 Tax=Hordeum vulgare subsp. vulgare TaxID=112509 RepID=F2E4U2_HORVV|nr:predicted protein [Hordeum vulgare subsp. vulgare]